MIVCKKCNVSKPESDFPMDRIRPSGLFPYCKSCCCELQRLNKKNKQSPIQQTKTCKKCHIHKPLSEFPEQKGRRDGRSSCCLPCAAWGRELFIKSRKARGASKVGSHYTKNKEQIRANEKAMSRRRKAELIESAGGKCVACSLSFSDEWPQCCFDFHHLAPKKFNISELLARSETFYLRHIQIEIDKCVLLCSNCHRKVHSGDLTLRVSLPQNVQS